MTIIAGTGENASSGDGGPAVQAALKALESLALDAAGNLHVADANGRGSSPQPVPLAHGCPVSPV